ncbi:GTPase Era, mitochondrial [Anopheles aquasalis]|uniref:GTPase Era, mitochondrial n=1 Tax=Anopheles aquasalis TaxID=42839 RepID=UPI00215AD219|nr:GTPase Era, mitochondrial [Anopheles aquasalis]XP_050091244.1 GTPase Era, mitochondrial [Anopheles aquasalis]
MYDLKVAIWLLRRFRVSSANFVPPQRCLATAHSAENGNQHTDQPATTSGKEKLIKVAMIGMPNAGKSTLINRLIDQRVCPVSAKVHTTRRASKAIHSRSNSQAILFDTPGLVGNREIKKHQLDAQFVSACRHAIQHSSLIGVVHDVSNSWTRHALNPVLLRVLEEYSHLPSFLILNKIDTLKSKRILLDIVKNLTCNRVESIRDYVPVRRRNKLAPQLAGQQEKQVQEEPSTDAPVQQAEGWPHFTEIFMVSAMTGDGLRDVMTFVHGNAKPQAWEHMADEHTDQSPEQLIVQSVRARLLDFMPQEIPYLLQTELEFYEVVGGRVLTSVVVTCPSERIARLVCGESNGKLRQINEQVTSDLIETFGMPVLLTITTQVRSKEPKA